MSEVDGEAALAHLAVPNVHLALAEVLLHYQVALHGIERANEPRSKGKKGINQQNKVARKGSSRV